MMKMKSLLCMLLAVVLLPVFAAAEETSADMLTLSELTQWAERCHQRAIAAEPVNDPAVSLTEDGYEFIYEFATIYADTPYMSEDTVLREIVLTDPAEEGPRGTAVDDAMAVVLSAYYHENASLAGSYESAVLYMMDMLPEQLCWGQVQRDGQRVETIQYAVHEQLSTGGEGYSDAGVIYTMQEGSVAAIRVYGLDARISEDAVHAVGSGLMNAALENSYVQVPFSFDGSALEVFGAEDLTFAGMDFLTVTPDDVIAALGTPMDDTWLDDGENGFIRTMTYDMCEITFLCDAQKLNPAMYMLLITADGVEGPRAVRIGDTYAEVFNRFRNGEGEFDGMSREVLYGDEAYGSFGVAEYGADASATLRYGLVFEDGSRVVLHMEFTTMALSQIMLYMAD